MFRAKHKRRYRKLFRENLRQGMPVEDAADDAGAQLLAEVGETDYKIDSDEFWTFMEKLLDWIIRLINIFSGLTGQQTIKMLGSGVLEKLDSEPDSQRANAA